MLSDSLWNRRVLAIRGTQSAETNPSRFVGRTSVPERCGSDNDGISHVVFATLLLDPFLELWSLEEHRFAEEADVIDVRMCLDLFHSYGSIYREWMRFFVEAVQCVILFVGLARHTTFGFEFVLG